MSDPFGNGSAVVERRPSSDPIGDGEGSLAADVLSSGRALQQVRTAYTTAVAVQQPRRLATVERRLLEEARLGGDDFYYGWRAGQDTIEGPSVKLAMAAARCWGNCAVDALPVQELHDAWVFTAAFIDLETGFTLTRQFRQSKRWTVHGKLDEQRKEDVRFQIGQSKAARNCILNALPASLVNHAMIEAKSGVREKIEKFVKEKGLAAAVDAILSALAKSGVKEEQVLARADVAARNGLTIEHIVTLRGDLSAIQSGQERASDLFPSAPDAKTKDLAAQLAAKAAAAAQQQPAEPVTEAVASEPAPSAERRTAPSKISKPAVHRIQEAAKDIPAEEFAELLRQEYGVAAAGELTREQGEALEARLKG